MSSGDAQVCLGVIVGARGVKGDVRIKSFAADPQDVAAYGPVVTENGTSITLKVTGQAKGVVIGRIDGVNTREAVEALKGQKLYVARAALPETNEEEFYHADLVGMMVVDETGKECGTVSAIYDFGAGDVIDLRLTDARTVMIPFTRAAVPSVDVAGGQMVVLAEVIKAAEEEPKPDGSAQGDSGGRA